MKFTLALLILCGTVSAATIVDYSFTSTSGTALGSPGVLFNFTGSSGSLTTLPGGPAMTATVGQLMLSVDPGISHALTLNSAFPVTSTVAGQLNQTALQVQLNFSGGQWLYSGALVLPPLLKQGFLYETIDIAVTGGAADGTTSRPVTLTATALVTPEPSSLALMGFALIVGLRTMRRRNRL